MELKYILLEYVSQHHILGTASEHRNHKNVRVLYRTKLVQYILEAVQENPLTPSSAAKEVHARIDLLQAAKCIANSLRRVSRYF
jgi:hypothetical protein